MHLEKFAKYIDILCDILTKADENIQNIESLDFELWAAEIAFSATPTHDQISPSVKSHVFQGAIICCQALVIFVLNIHICYKI
jgi:hypothetical protein